MKAAITFRELEVPEAAEGMRLDRFLALRFADRSRSWIAKGIGAGQVRDEADRPLRRSSIVRMNQVLRLYLPGIAPSEPAPPCPAVIHEDDKLVVLDKPPGMIAHPAGTNFVWSLIRVAKDNWPAHRVDLVHRLDRHTSGVIVLTKELDANRFLKERLKAGRCRKVYLAIVKGWPSWDQITLTGPIGEGNDEVRLKRAVTPDGLSARTDVTVLGRREAADGRRISLVQCRIHTGRTHQIRVHLWTAGFPLLGDRLYGVPASVFLGFQDHGDTPELVARAGAERHALHAHSLSVGHPDGHELTLTAPMPADMAGWWNDPDSLAWDGAPVALPEPAREPALA